VSLRRAPSSLALLLALATAAAPPRAAAQAPSPPPPAAPCAVPDAAARIDPCALGLLLDSAFAVGMPRDGIPGAAITVVERGRVVLARGYGVAELERRTPVSADTTRFAVGSVTKLVTAIAALQLAESGRLAMDEDVGRYIAPVTIDRVSPEPITLEQLLTHTSGIDRRDLAMAVSERSRMVPLADFLAPNLPPQVHPAGSRFWYSDHGVALAGLAVQGASGAPYESYVEAAIFRPLGMTRSSVRADAMEGSDRAMPHERYSGRPRPVGLTYPLIVPAGSLVTSAGDMARLMIAVLEGGEAGGARILSTVGMSEMLRPRVGHHPALARYALGLYEYSYGGVRGLRHQGWLAGNTAVLWLVPEHRLGIFLATNADEAETFGNEVIEAVHRRFLRGDTLRALPEPPPGAAARAARRAGTYRKYEFGGQGIERLAREMFAAEWRVTPTADGALELNSGRGPIRAVELGPSLYGWQWRDVVDGIAFGGGDGERPAELYVGLDAYERMPWWRTRPVERALALVLLAVFASVVAWPFVWGARRGLERLELTRRSRRARGGGAAAPAVRAPWLLAGTAAAALGNLLFVGGFAYYLTSRPYLELGYGFPAPLRALLWLPLLTGLLALALLAVLVVRRPRWGPALRAHAAVILVAALAFTAALGALQVLGPQQEYLVLEPRR
jgi:CubicO group peptidase (beta-lactamase class C family)